jgi:peptidoglycan/xylan/chitin deacetylase (PgdA/CDA1 family)
MRHLIVGATWLSPIALIILWPYAPLAGLTIMMLSHAAWLYATLRANAQWLGPVVTRFDTKASEVWLTIDDGPTSDTPAILDLLAERRVRATFFLKGALARQNPERVRAMLDGGHTVANHSATHPSAAFWCLPWPDIASEIDRCGNALESLIGARPRWFRAPVGMKNPAVHPLLSERGMRLIGWSVRGLDTMRSDPADVAGRIVPRCRPGSIILLHQGREHSLPCIERVVAEVQQHGYTFVVPSDERLKTKR